LAFVAIHQNHDRHNATRCSVVGLVSKLSANAQRLAQARPVSPTASNAQKLAAAKNLEVIQETFDITETAPGHPHGLVCTTLK
jgi:hypothetical protein